MDPLPWDVGAPPALVVPLPPILVLSKATAAAAAAFQAMLRPADAPRPLLLLGKCTLHLLPKYGVVGGEIDGNGVLN